MKKGSSFFSMVACCTLSAFFIAIMSGGLMGCSGSGGPSDGGGGLTYPESVALYTQKGLTAAQIEADLAASYGSFINTNVGAADAPTLQSLTDNYADDLSALGTLVNDLEELGDIAYPGGIPSAIKFQSVDPSGVDSLNSHVNTVLAKKAQCDALFAAVPSLPTTPADFEKLEMARACARELQQLSVASGFDAAVIGGAGGLVGGAAGGAAVIYLGGSVLSGGGLIVVTVAGVVVSRIAGYMWSACSATGSNLKAQTAGQSCFFNGGGGSTGSPMVVQAQGTGSLQVFVEGCAPFVLSGATITPGQTLSINMECQPLDDNLTPENVSDGANGTTTNSGPSQAVACADIIGLTATTVPADPGVGQNVTVNIQTQPPASGCSINFTVSGTDGYSNAGNLTSDGAGTSSFGIPAASVQGTVDTVTVTESASGNSATIHYAF